jgi:hypothetical protein
MVENMDEIEISANNSCSTLMKYILYIVYSFFCLILFMYIEVYALLMTGAQGCIRIKMQLKMNYQ